MTPEQRFERLKSHLVGRRITFRRLACDSLLVYLNCQPGDGTGDTIWFEPIWHVLSSAGVLLGSMQAAEAAMISVERMDEVAVESLEPLLGKMITDLSVDPCSFDLTVKVGGEYSIRTFVADATTEESWHIRDNASGERLKGSPRGLEIVVRPPRRA